MIRELTRPIGEIARLIQQNIQLAEKFKQNDLNDLVLLEPKKLPQKLGKIITFDYPRTVCTSKNVLKLLLWMMKKQSITTLIAIRIVIYVMLNVNVLAIRAYDIAVQ